MKRLVAFLIVITLTLLPTSTVKAIDDPDSLLWTSAVGYSGVVETGDFLIIAGYNIAYAVTPVEIATETFLTSVSFEGSVIQTANIVSMNDNGYNEGLISFFFSPDEASDLSLTTIGLWEVTVQGSPAIFPSPQTVTTSSIVFITGAASNLAITVTLRSHANFLEALWNADGDTFDLIEGSLFASDGEDYFERVIPNLRQIAPYLFGGSIQSASYLEFEETFTQDERAARRSVLDGSTLDTSLIAIEDEWRIPWEISAALIFYTIVAIFAIFYMRTPNAKVEFVFLVFLVATPFGAWAGMVDMVFAALVTFASVAAIVYFVSWR